MALPKKNSLEYRKYQDRVAKLILVLAWTVGVALLITMATP